MKKMRKVLPHAFLVIAPLLVAFFLTLAWFLGSSVSDLTPMSLAASDTGPGATLYRSTVEQTARQYNGVSLTNTVTWQDPAKPEDSEITIENMVPGQCEYFLLNAKRPTRAFFSRIVLTDEAGNSVTTGRDLPLAQCLSIYLQPITLPETAVIPGRTDVVTVALTRTAVDSFLTDTLFRDTLPTATAPIVVKDSSGVVVLEAQKTYIMAVFLDPIYLQGLDQSPVNTLAGTVQFSLQFEEELTTEEPTP